MEMYHYWGKTARGAAHQGDAYHLLCWHALDVAACGYKMVEHNLFHAADCFAALGIDDRERAGQFFAWLLLWHDIGKFSRLFQQQFTHPDLGTAPRDVRSSGHHHTATGKWLWKNHLRDRVVQQVTSPLPTRKVARLLDAWLAISLGHHGTPAASQVCANDFLPEDINAACAYADEIGTLFPAISLPADWAKPAWQAVFQPLSWLLSGVTVMADWLGSNNRYFPMVSAPGSFSGYWQRALVQAEQAIHAIPAPSQVAPFSGIQTLFPFIEHPTPLQQLASTLNITASGPQLFILEDVTGAGKTEAALVLAHRLMAQGKGQGMYIGLPTMATANAMYSRMYQTWARLYQPDARPSLMLAHSARALSELFSRSVWDPAAEMNESGDEVPAAQGCAAWFADSRKKALLAEVGVGTLDQALMAVLPFRHQNVRLLGLNQKILLADEIHAYDAYTSHLLEALIAAQAASGNTTILLSATLSQAQRNRFAAAFSRGTAQSLPAPVIGLYDYPWLTHLTSTTALGYPVATRPQVQRRVAVRWLESEEACLAVIRDAVSRGECVAWIRNSVDDAAASYRQLCAALPDAAILLFHSRFAFQDRLEIEQHTLDWFGKAGEGQRAGKVLVATQVVEQSLDLDFDVLISDIAPVDLLIQRAGRLQRHVRDAHGHVKTDGQDERPSPVLHILAPVWCDVPTGDWLSAPMRNTSRVYSDHTTLWLTQRVLRQQGEIRMPESARLLIEAVYSEDRDVPAALQAASDRAEGAFYSARALAGNSEIGLTTAYGADGSCEGWNDAQSTRLGEASEAIWLAYRRDGEVVPYADGDHAWEMSALRVRASWWQKHARQFTCLEGDALDAWRRARRQTSGQVIILPEDPVNGGYSPRTGLLGRGGSNEAEQ
ncbi:CRISPR-associated helicase Cas3' [Siccibacter turicensis]|uniref:CRISPR-associated helicase Cas3' n=1 Tax=Siccibacter turicensis TaxID=357233 RepID=UPI0039C8D213